jgi:hypothetical protein
MSSTRKRPASEDGPRDPRARAVRHRACSAHEGSPDACPTAGAPLGGRLHESNTVLGLAQEKQALLLSVMKQASATEGPHALLEQIVEEVECSVCLERPADTCFAPCGHCYCNHADCGSSQLDKCPQCSKRVRRKTELFGAVKFIGEVMLKGDEARKAAAAAEELQMERAANVAEHLVQVEVLINASRDLVAARDNADAEHDKRTGVVQRQVASIEALLRTAQQRQQQSNGKLGAEEKLSKTETSREGERAAHKAQVEEERQRLAALREEHRNVQSALGRLWQLQSEAEWQLAEMRSEVDKLQHELSSAPRALPVDARVMLQKWQVPIILGEGGTIPRRIQRASGAQIEVKEADGDRFACVELRGAQQQCRWDGVLCGV